MSGFVWTDRGGLDFERLPLKGVVLFVFIGMIEMFPIRLGEGKESRRVIFGYAFYCSVSQLQ